MTDGISLSLAFATGVLGTLHCLGMCSGIAGGLLVRCGGGARISPLLAFHGTRILVYAILGVTGAALGRVLAQTGLIGKGQGMLMMGAGVLIVVLGLDLLGLRLWRNRGGLAPEPRNIEVRLGGDPPRRRAWLPVLAGALNGLVPCSLVFSVAAKAAATADPVRAGALMVAFGLGTLPTMGLVSLTGVVLGARVRNGWAKLAGVAVVTLGLWTLYEGYLFFDIMRGLDNW